MNLIHFAHGRYRNHGILQIVTIPGRHRNDRILQTGNKTKF